MLKIPQIERIIMKGLSAVKKIRGYQRISYINFDKTFDSVLWSTN